MDEVGQNEKPKRARVLRAGDIIPPFDKIPAAGDAGGVELEPPEPAVVGAAHADGPTEGDSDRNSAHAGPGGRDAGSPPSAGGEILKYDLAENILAEQRRVAARRRRAPSQAEEPPATPEPSDAKPAEPELSSEDLPELQRIVAEIVARDIERLCRRPDEGT